MGNFEVSYVQQLMENQIPESRILEFKRELWGTSDSEKKEMLKDVSALANTDGGQIIIGVEENEGIITEIIGVDVDNIDETIDRLNQSLTTGIEPVITGLEISYIMFDDGKYLITIEVPRSWISPHMIAFKRTSRFYKRSSSNVYQLGVQEIRDEFLMTETITQRINNFRFSRYELLNNRDLFPTLRYPTCLVVHSIPMNSFLEKRDYFEVRKEVGRTTVIPTFDNTDNRWRYNFEGLFAPLLDSSGRLQEYSQFFRNGTFELASHCPFISRKENNGNSEKFIASQIFINYLVNGLFSTLDYQKKLGCNAPIILFVGLLNVSGYSIALNQGGMSYPIENENLYLPEKIIEVIPETRSQTQDMLHDVIDMVWNAGGIEYL